MYPVAFDDVLPLQLSMHFANPNTTQLTVNTIIPMPMLLNS